MVLSHHTVHPLASSPPPASHPIALRLRATDQFKPLLPSKQRKPIARFGPPGEGVHQIDNPRVGQLAERRPIPLVISTRSPVTIRCSRALAASDRLAFGGSYRWRSIRSSSSLRISSRRAIPRR